MPMFCGYVVSEVIDHESSTCNCKEVSIDSRLRSEALERLEETLRESFFFSLISELSRDRLAPGLAPGSALHRTGEAHYLHGVLFHTILLYATNVQYVHDVGDKSEYLSRTSWTSLVVRLENQDCPPVSAFPWL